MDGITDDLTNGFDIMSKVRPGPGWRKRTDGRYNDPEHIDEVCRRNRQYVCSRLQRPTPSKYAEQLLEELVDEQRLGRVVGPLRAPADWPCKTVALPNISGCDVLLDPPGRPVPGSGVFPDRCRRTKQGTSSSGGGRTGGAPVTTPQWRRTTYTDHTVGDFVDLARRMAEEDTDLLAFGHDMLNAYRQWPVRRPEHCATFLPTAAGVTLWMHMAMCFGAAASVWNFNRAGDAVQLVVRALVFLLGGHYVDDFNVVDFGGLADSAFDTFGGLFGDLGLQTKPSKAQPPARDQVIQGVCVRLGETGVTVQPTQRRVAKLQTMIQEILDTGVLDPTAAQRLSGKLGFLTQAVFGAVGRAAIQPIHKSAAQPALMETNLTPKLVDALMASAALLENIRPRFIPYSGPKPAQATIFADAFFVDHGRRVKAGHVPEDAGRHRQQRRRNGWGYVVQIGDQVFYDFGEEPPWFLDVFAERKAFIYALEILAQVLALAAFAAKLPPLWTAYIDNIAGQCALTKGYGNHGAVNGMVAAVWGLAATQAWAPHFQRVPSADNISDALSRGDESEACRPSTPRPSRRRS